MDKEALRERLEEINKHINGEKAMFTMESMSELIFEKKHLEEELKNENLIDM